MTEKIFAIYGASGFGREVLPLAKDITQNKDAKLIFIDDENKGVCNGIKIMQFEQFISLESKEKHVCLAIADNKIRQYLFHKLEENNISHWSVSAKNSTILNDCIVGENSILAPFVTLTSNIRIGKSFQANLYSYVGHDCRIGNFVTFAPAVKCNGNVKIEDNVYIGTGAIIKQGTSKKPLVIGEGAVIGMGAIITKNVPPGTKIVARPQQFPLQA